MEERPATRRVVLVAGGNRGWSTVARNASPKPTDGDGQRKQMTEEETAGRAK